jgi:hypothetical protein
MKYTNINSDCYQWIRLGGDTFFFPKRLVSFKKMYQIYPEKEKMETESTLLVRGGWEWR